MHFYKFENYICIIRCLYIDDPLKFTLNIHIVDTMKYLSCANHEMEDSEKQVESLVLRSLGLKRYFFASISMYWKDPN